MGSEDREVRAKQYEKARAVYKARKAAIAEKGLDEKAAQKDTVLRNLGAKLKKARGRVKAIEATEAYVKEVAAKETRIKKKGSKGKKKAPAGGGKDTKGAKGAKGAKGTKGTKEKKK